MTAKTTFQKNRSLFTLLFGILIIGIIIYLLREPLLPFAFGLVIAYLLLPLVDWIDRRMPFFEKKGHYIQRVVIIVLTFVILLTLIVLIGIFLTVSVAGSFSNLFTNAPSIITDGLYAIGQWMESVIGTLTEDVQKQVHDAINNVGSSIGQWLQGAFITGISFVGASVTFVIGFLALPFFLIFFMANAHSLGKGFYTLFPGETGRHIRNIAGITDRIVGRYIGAQLLLAVIVAVTAYIGFMIVGLELAAALAIIAGVFQLIPTIGGAMAAIIGIIVIIAISPDKLVWVVVIYVLINFIGNTILAPKLQGDAVNIDPAIVMMLIIVGGYLGGILGMILITPIVALLYELYKYVNAEIQRSNSETPSV
ncbi:MAG TPA: hypothetical protein DCX22_02635 [Dehalococcoidia bacterium]|nr:hypothetical protein [Dehalococcoidia bacterium]